MSVAEIEAREIAMEAPSGLWADAWDRLKRNPGAIVGFVMVGIFVLVALLAPVIAPHSPTQQDLSLIRGGCCPGPSLDHPFGIEIGRAHV